MHRELIFLVLAILVANVAHALAEVPPRPEICASLDAADSEPDWVGDTLLTMRASRAALAAGDVEAALRMQELAEFQLWSFRKSDDGTTAENAGPILPARSDTGDVSDPPYPEIVSTAVARTRLWIRATDDANVIHHIVYGLTRGLRDNDPFAVELAIEALCQFSRFNDAPHDADTIYDLMTFPHMMDHRPSQAHPDVAALGHWVREAMLHRFSKEVGDGPRYVAELSNLLLDPEEEGARAFATRVFDIMEARIAELPLTSSDYPPFSPRIQELSKVARFAAYQNMPGTARRLIAAARQDLLLIEDPSLLARREIDKAEADLNWELAVQDYNRRFKETGSKN